MLKPWFQQICTVKKEWSVYTFHNLRDFHRTTQGAGQKQNWIEKSFDSSKIDKVWVYFNPFAFHNRIGHTFLEFWFSDGQKLCVSAEGEQKLGESYSVIKSIRPWYRIRYLRWTHADTIGLRFNRKDKLYVYPMYMSKEHIQQLFRDLVEETNKTGKHNEPYWLLFNNCTSWLRMVARKHLPIPKWNIWLLFNKFLPKMLHKLDVLKLSERKRVREV